MKIANKIRKVAILVVIALFLIVAVGGYIFGELALKMGVETAATKALGVGVYIGDIDLSILKGAVTINDLNVRNPAGYTLKNLLELGNGKATVRMGSLFEKTVHIQDLTLSDINLLIEQKGFSNNLKDMISSIPTKPEQAPEEAKKGKKLQIDNLEINNIKVKVKLIPLPGQAETITLNLAPIKMSNLGGDNKLDTAILAKKIMVAIAEGVAKQGVGILPKDMVGALKSTLDKTIGIGTTTLKEGEKILDTGKDVGTEIVDGLKGLLKPKKKE